MDKKLCIQNLLLAYLGDEFVDEGIHEIGLPLLPVDDSHGVKGHRVVVLERQQLCYLPEMTPRLLGEGFVGLEQLGNGIRVVLLRNTAYGTGRRIKLIMSWLHHRIWSVRFDSLLF
jgi:hypothetical protein